MPIINRIAEFHREMTEWRQDLHAHPELALQETRTSGVVQAKLKEFGVDEVITGMARTGVVGVIKGSGDSQRAIGLRADMDALPIVEETGVPHASQNQGVMHACGHDGHTTMLLGAAKYLAETRNFDGTVYVIFQPAEENLAGGEIMVKEGLFERCKMDMVFGLHNWPQMPEGTFAWRNGPIMAAVANIEITITGKATEWARTADSGNVLRYSFCPLCGSTVHWENTGFPDIIAIAIGTFADPYFPPPSISVWEECRHAWVTSPADPATKRMAKQG